MSPERQLPIRRLGLLVNFTRPRAREGLPLLVEAARGAGIRLMAPPETAALMPSDAVAPVAAHRFVEAGAQGVISLGGDGSLLAAAHLLAGMQLPLIGFNVGSLGYLTAVNEDGFAGALRALSEGRYCHEERLTLEAQLSAAGTTLPDALNDVVVSRANGGHAIALRVSVDGFPVARWLCDGLILATPTGSTAYSLAVGGPVVMPAAKAIVLSAIAPHALSARPLVIPATSAVDVRIDNGETASVYADGQCAEPLCAGDVLTVRNSGRTCTLLVPEGHNPYASLAGKLGWGSGFTR